MAKFDFKNVQIISTGATIKGVDFGLTVPDAIKDELKKFNSFKSFEISGTLDLSDYKPVFDPKEWAKSNGLEVTDKGIFCYKAVYQLTAGDVIRYFAPRNLVLASCISSPIPRGSIKKYIFQSQFHFEVGTPFEYILNEEVECDYFETDPEMECAPGLYGSTKELAENFMYPWINKVAILKLFVPFADNKILVPYCGYTTFPLPSDKFRFKRCIPVSAKYKIPTKMPSKKELFDHWEWKMAYSLCEALDDPAFVLQIFSVVDKNKFFNSAVAAMQEVMERQEE